MSDADTVTIDMRNAIDQIEEAYEFMIAYAAQGRKQEPETEGASQIRGYLERFRQSLDTIRQSIPAMMSEHANSAAFAERFSSDLDVMQSVLDLIVSRDSISSDMIDNTNGLISVRSLLTDLFFIDQVVLPPR